MSRPSKPNLVPRPDYQPFDQPIRVVSRGVTWVQILALVLASIAILFSLTAFGIIVGYQKNVHSSGLRKVWKVKCPSVIHVPSSDFPTLTDVTKYFQNRHACNSEVRVAPGTYNDMIRMEGFSSSYRFGNVSQGLTFVCDTEDYALAGMAYVHGGHNNVHDDSASYAGAFGNPVTLTLSTPTSIEIDVVGSTLDLTQGGYTFGDQILIRDDTGTYSERNITSITANTVFFSAGNEIIIGSGSYIVFMPACKIVNPTNWSATVSLTQSAAGFRGFWFQMVQPASFSNMALTSSHVSIDSCVFDDRFGYSRFSNLVALQGSSVDARRLTESSLFYNYPGFSVHVVNTFIRGTVGCVTLTQESANAHWGDWNLFDGTVFNLYSGVSNFNVRGLQTVSYNPPGFTHIYAGYKKNVEMELWTAIQNQEGLFTYAFLDDSDASLDAWGGISLTGPADYGIYARTTATVAPASLSIDGATVGLALLGNSRLNVDNSVTFSNIGGREVETQVNTVYNAPNDPASPYNQYTYIASGEMVNYLKNQIIGAEIPLNITLDPSLGISSDIYIGKTYSLSTSTTQNHQLFLLNGAVFEGCSAPPGSNIIIFDGTVGGTILFRVESATLVRLIVADCVTYNAYSKKFIHKRSESKVFPPMTHGEIQAMVKI
jgi:hypothetical protein